VFIHNVKVHCNLVDSIATLVAVPMKSNLDEFTNGISYHQSSFAGAQTDDFAQYSSSTEHFVRY